MEPDPACVRERMSIGYLIAYFALIAAGLALMTGKVGAGAAIPLAAAVLGIYFSAVRRGYWYLWAFVGVWGTSAVYLISRGNTGSLLDFSLSLFAALALVLAAPAFRRGLREHRGEIEPVPSDSRKHVA